MKKRAIPMGVAVAMVALLAWPAEAADFRATGVQRTVIRYHDGGIPLSTVNCTPTTFDVVVRAFVALTDTTTSYTGPIRFTGSGWSWCEDTTQGFGGLDMSATGTNRAGHAIDCPTLTGGWLRPQLLIEMTGKGACSIDGVPIGDIWFVLDGVWTPVKPLGGVTGAITKARSTGHISTIV